MGTIAGIFDDMGVLREASEAVQAANGGLLLEQERSDKEREMLWKKVEELETRLRLVSDERDTLNTENANLWLDIKAMGAERDALYKRAQQTNQDLEEAVTEIDALRKEREILRDTLAKAEILQRSMKNTPSAPAEAPYTVVVTENNLLRIENTRLWNLLQSIFGGCYEDS